MPSLRRSLTQQLPRIGRLGRSARAAVARRTGRRARRRLDRRPGLCGAVSRARASSRCPDVPLEVLRSTACPLRSAGHAATVDARPIVPHPGRRGRSELDRRHRPSRTPRPARLLGSRTAASSRDFTSRSASRATRPVRPRRCVESLMFTPHLTAQRCHAEPAVGAQVTLRIAGSGSRASRRRRRARRAAAGDTPAGTLSKANRPCSPGSAAHSRSPCTRRIASAAASTHPSMRREPSSVAVTCSRTLVVPSLNCRVAVSVSPRTADELRALDEGEQRVLARQVLDGDGRDHPVDQLGRHRIDVFPHLAHSGEQRRIRGEVFSFHRCHPLPIRRPRGGRGACRGSADGSARSSRSASPCPGRCGRSQGARRTRRCAAGAGIDR